MSFRRCLRAVVFAIVAPMLSGCGPFFGLPTILPQGSQKDQIAEAKRFDPFPDPDIAPAVVGGRPQGFLNPRPEPDVNKMPPPEWLNPAVAASYPPGVNYPATTVSPYPGPASYPASRVAYPPATVIYPPAPVTFSPAAQLQPSPAAASSAVIPAAYGKKIDAP